MAEVFGERLKRLREKKGLTKEAFCNDGEYLSVRQLSRLELGQSQPTLPTLKYIAKRLEMSLAEVTGEELERAEVATLPKDYLDLKNRFIRITSYGNKEVIAEKEEILDLILEQYYDDLPEEEQLAIDILQSTLYTFQSEDDFYGGSIVEEHLERVLEKPSMSLNDLLIVDLYQGNIDLEKVSTPQFDWETYRRVSKKLVNYKESLSDVEATLLINLLLSIPMVESFGENQVVYSQKAIKRLNKLMDATQDFQKKPIVKMMEWKYALNVEENQEKAEVCFAEAIALAKLFSNTYLIKQLENEWEQDINVR